MATAGLFKLVVRILKINNLSQFFALVNIYYVGGLGGVPCGHCRPIQTCCPYLENK